MRRFLITIQYLGKNYYGFQLQINENKRTVQGEIEKALEQVFHEKIKIFSSGRLDAGVNALALKAHFDTENKIDASKICGGLNHFLPEDISITEVKEVNLDFHARYGVKRKTYEYAMYVSSVRLAILDERAKQIYKQPNIRLMKVASKYLMGKHDFSAFMNQGSSIKTTIRTIEKLTIKQKNNMIFLKITGDGFLYNMVRILVGTLLDVGYKKIKPVGIKDILESKSRKKASKMVEAKGLTLMNVEY